MEEARTTNTSEKMANSSEKASAEVKSGENSSGGSKIPLIIAAVLIVLAGLTALFIWLGPETTGMIRDIMLIVFALESVVTVAAVTVLCINTAKLVIFLKYEVEPILNTTGKTVKKFSGTVSFLCENAVEPTVETVSTISGVMNAANSVLSIFKR